MIAGVVHLVELVPAAEFGADRIPQELEHLDALLVADAVGAAHVAREILVDLGIAEILGRGRQIDQCRGHDLLHDLLHPPIGVAREHAIARARLRVRQHRAVDPRRGIERHGVGQRPEQIPPGDDLAQHRLVAAELVAAGGAQRLGDHAHQEIELDRQPRAALELVAGEEARLREEDLQLVEVAVQEHVLPWNERVVEHEDGVVLVEARRQRIVVGRAHHARHHLVGGAAEQLHARRIHRRDEHDREVGYR